MICPMMSRPLLNSPKGEATYVECQKEGCAWWSDRFAMCSRVIDAHQRAVEDCRKEAKAAREW